MVERGETAPEFSAPLARGDSYGDIGEFTLSDALGNGPVVLAFYPAAFTGGCTDEMCSFRDSMTRFDDLDATVYGVSVDLPSAQNVWIDELNLGFPMISDWDHKIIRAYGVVRDDVFGMVETARRSIFVLDSEGRVAHRWVRSTGDTLDYDRLVTDTADAVARVRRE